MPPWPFSLTIRRPTDERLALLREAAVGTGDRRGRNGDRGGPQQRRRSSAAASFFKMWLGHSESGFAGVETALRLSPRDPLVPNWQFFICHLHTHLAQWEQAIEWCNKSIAGDPQSFVHAGRPRRRQRLGRSRQGSERGRRPIAESLSRLHRETWAGIHWTDDPTFNAQYARIVEGLRKAGLPEGEKKNGLNGPRVPRRLPHPSERLEHQLQILWT